MAAAGARVEFDDKAVREGLAEAVVKGADPTAMLADIGAYLVGSSQRRFEAEAGPNGVKWAPFARSTIRSMPKRRKPAKLLRDRNRLFQSLTYEVTGSSVVEGTNLDYAGAHQFGAEIDRPARTQSIAFRMAKEGAASKLDKDGNVIRYGSRLRFAKASSRAKNVTRKLVDISAGTFRIPARPYLGVDKADEVAILEIAAEHTRQATGAEGQP